MTFPQHSAPPSDPAARRLSRRQARGAVVAGAQLGGAVGLTAVVVGWLLAGSLSGYGLLGAGPPVLSIALVALLLAAFGVTAYLTLGAHGVNRRGAVVLTALGATALASMLIAALVLLASLALGAFTLSSFHSSSYWDIIAWGSTVVIVLVTGLVAMLVTVAIARAYQRGAPFTSGPIPASVARVDPGIRI